MASIKKGDGEFGIDDNAAALPLSLLRISIADMMTLRVRSEAQHAAPKFLYQSLPEKAMRLFAAMPHDAAAISIPLGNEYCDGYPLSASAPREFQGFVIVYARQSDGIYKAVEVLFRGGSFSVARFCRDACLQLGEPIDPSIISTSMSYAYCAPSRALWGVIVNDGGYTALDPAKMSKEISAELVEKWKNNSSSGIIARIPAQPERQPTFTRVEITFDPLNDDPHWISFVEHRRIRAMRSRPPQEIIANFRDWLGNLSGESGITTWAFRKGMFFGDHIEWWGTKDQRRTEHEGLDFLEGTGHDSENKNIPEGTPVRSMAAGEIVAQMDDFLGKSLLVCHPAIVDGHGFFYTVYSHIVPCDNANRLVEKGEIIGRIGKSENMRIPAHLHLSGAWMPRSIDPKTLTIDHINQAYAPIVLINFNSLLRLNIDARG